MLNVIKKVFLGFGAIVVLFYALVFVTAWL